MTDVITSYTITLSFVGIIISIASLIFAIIYLVKLCELQKIQRDLSQRITLLDSVKVALIPLCALYRESGGMISGEIVIKTICDHFNCDEWRAIQLFRSNDPCLKLIDWDKISNHE